MEMIKTIELPTSAYFRTLRAYHGLSQKEVAEQIRVSTPTIISIEDKVKFFSVKFESIFKLNEFYKGLNDGND